MAAKSKAVPVRRIGEKTARVCVPGDIVMLEWEDAYHDGNGHADDLKSWSEKHDPAICHSAGHLIYSDKRGVMVGLTAIDYQPHQGFLYQDTTFVPRGMVRKLTFLAPGPVEPEKKAA